MTQATMTKADAQIHHDVLEELKWDSRVDETEVGVQVASGVVTLTGSVTSWAKRVAAQEAAHRVIGVHDVANDIKVKTPGGLTRTDTEIAQAVRRALEWDVFVPEDKITSTVTDGWVTLDGAVDTWSQRNDAERAVRNLTGVKLVLNKITVKPTKPVPEDVRRAIEQALERRAEREARRIRVDVKDGVVTLMGAFIRGRSASRSWRPPASRPVCRWSRTVCERNRTEPGRRREGRAGGVRAGAKALKRDNGSRHLPVVGPAGRLHAMAWPRARRCGGGPSKTWRRAGSSCAPPRSPVSPRRRGSPARTCPPSWMWCIGSTSLARSSRSPRSATSRARVVRQARKRRRTTARRGKPGAPKRATLSLVEPEYGGFSWRWMAAAHRKRRWPRPWR